MSSNRKIIESALGDLAQTMAGTVVAGGFVRDTLGGYPIKGDIDFFIEKSKLDRGGIGALSKIFWQRDPNNKAAYVCRTRNPHLHLITLQRDPLEFIKERFDFVACCGAIELGSTREWFHENFERDVKEQAITVNNTLVLTVKSLLRAFKFAKRGWHIDTNTIAQLVSACAMSTPALRDALVDEVLLTHQLSLAFEPGKGIVTNTPNAPTEEVRPAREYNEPRNETVERLRRVLRNAPVPRPRMRTLTYQPFNYVNWNVTTVNDANAIPDEIILEGTGQ